MNAVEITAFVKAEKAAAVFALVRDTGQTATTVCRSRAGEKPAGVGLRFWKRAESFVDETGIGGRFVVVSHDDAGKVLDTLPIVFEGNGLEVPPTMHVEKVTPDFALRHSIKAIEGRDISSRKLMSELHAEYRRDLASKARRIEALEDKLDDALKERIRTVEAVETLKSQAHTRQLAQVEAMSNAKQQAWIFEKVVTAMPAIVGALTGGTKAHKFVQGLKPEEREVLSAMAANLEPKQLALYNDLMGLGDKADKAIKRLAAPDKANDAA